MTAPHDTDDVTDESGGWLVVVSGWTGAGKSTLADGLAHEFDATVVSFDWVMSGLRALPEVWDAVETPVELQRRVGWNLLSRVAEQQLRRGASCILDLVAREEPRLEWETLARRYDARFGVVGVVQSRSRPTVAQVGSDARGHPLTIIGSVAAWVVSRRRSGVTRPRCSAPSSRSNGSCRRSRRT